MPALFYYRLSVRRVIYSIFGYSPTFKSVYPRQAWRLVQDPVKGIFVPLIVRRVSCQSRWKILIFASGTLLCHYHHWNRQLCFSLGACECRVHIRAILVSGPPCLSAYFLLTSP